MKLHEDAGDCWPPVMYTVFKSISVPEPSPEYIQLEVKAKPITLGHEVAGVITNVGLDITLFCPGHRVAISQICHPVEKRDWTLSIGIGFDGGYAQYAVTPAAVATDALTSSYHAVAVEAGAKSGITVRVIGLGGLGMPGLAFGLLKGAILDDAKDVPFDVIVDFVGTGSTLQAALSAVKEGGKVVVVGLSAQMLTVPTEALILRMVTLFRSPRVGADDLTKVLKLLKDASVNLSLVEVLFADIHTSISTLAKGDVKGRLWTDPSKAVD
ncbi:hypothetical protein QL093DRAFT_2568175 [Fusarium oxysporum]|nr:hypothetical protein QL093DRAFT_2568175 [Fusarium oxysporum]